VKKNHTLAARSVKRRLASALNAGVSTWAMKLLDSADSIFGNWISNLPSPEIIFRTSVEFLCKNL
jgi:hypothetical protein